MLREKATIIAKQGNLYTLHSQRQSSCGSCSSKAGCGTSTLAQYMGNKPIEFEILDSADYKIGEQVELGLSEAGLLGGSFWLYLVPLLIFITGMAVVEELIITGNVVLFLVLALLSVGFIGLRHYIKNRFEQDKYKPVILGRMGIEETSISFIKN